MAFSGISLFCLTFSLVSARDFYIRSERDMITSMNTARPGDSIHLIADTIYYFQNVELTRSGLPHLPINLIGQKGTKISSDHTALVIRGSFWRIQNLAFENSPDGLVVYGHNNTLKSLSFHNIEEEALVLRGDGNMVKTCVFNGVNQGVILGGSENVLYKNSITALVTAVSAPSRSCCGRLEGNVFNGLLSVHGAEFTITKNIANSDVSISGPRNDFTGNVINGRLDVSGCANNFFGNTAGTSDFTSQCYNWDDGKNQFGSGNHKKLLAH